MVCLGGGGSQENVFENWFVGGVGHMKTDSKTGLLRGGGRKIGG